MAQAVIQSVQVLGTGADPTTLNGTFPTPTTAGNCIVICISAFTNSSGTYSVSACTLGATSLTQLVFQQIPGGPGPMVSVWALPNCPGGQTAFSVTVAGGASFGASQGITAYEAVGLAATIGGLLDTSSTAQASTGTAISSGVTATTASPSDMLFGAISSYSTISSISPSFTNTHTTYVSAGYDIPGTTGTFSYTATESSSHPWVSAVVALSPGPAPVTACFTAAGSWQGGDASSGTLTLNNQVAGDLVIAVVIGPLDLSTWPVTLSSAGCSWATVATEWGANNTATASMFLGTVLTPGTDTVTINWSSGPPLFASFAAQEFVSSQGNWTIVQVAMLDAATPQAGWPALTANGPNELYFGYSYAGAPGSAGTTSGFVWNADGLGDCTAYNLACSGVTAPVWGNAGQSFGLMVMLQDPGNSPDGIARRQHGGITWARRFRRHQQVPPVALAAPVVYGTATLDGAGAVTAPATVGAPASLDGAGTAAAAGVVTGAASLSGAGTAAGAGTEGAHTTLTGAAAVTAAAAVSAPATLTGVSALAAPLGTVAGITTLAGAGTSTGHGLVAGSATLPGAGTVTGVGVHPGTATLTGAGTVTAAGRVAGITEMDGAGTVQAVANSQSATLTATSALTAAAQATATAEADATTFLTATGGPAGITEMDAAGGLGAQPLILYSALLAAAGTVTTSTTVQATATLTGAGALSVTAAGTSTATMTATGALTATGVIPGTAALGGIALTYTPGILGPVTDPFTAPGISTGSGGGTLTATGTITGTAVLAASGGLTAAQSTGATALLAGIGVLSSGQGMQGVAGLAATTTLGAATGTGVTAELDASTEIEGIAVNQTLYEMSFM